MSGTAATARRVEPEGIIGSSPVRVDAFVKVSGSARYGADETPPGTAYGVFCTSAIGRGKIVAIDDEAARATPGFVDIFTHRNVGQRVHRGRWVFDFGYQTSAIAPLGTTSVHHPGQIVALIVGDSLETAQEAAAAVDIRYRPGKPARATLDDPKAEDVKPRALGKTKLSVGDAAAAMAGAEVAISAEYATPAQHNNPLEMYQATCWWEGGELIVRESTQNLRGTRYGLAKQLKMRARHVHVISPFVGGAFGSRELSQMTAIVAFAAKRLGRPVKLVATRQQMYTLRTFRAQTRHHVELAAGRDGCLAALVHDSVEATRKGEAYTAAGAEATARLYACPNIAIEVRARAIDLQTPGYMRAPQEFPYLFALESAMDELAWALELDPLELRRRNETRVDPIEGVPYTSRSLLECIDAGAAAFGWDRRVAAPRAMRDGDQLVGFGYATAFKPAMVGPADATVRLGPGAHARVEIGTHELGTGVMTVIAQVAADRLGLAVDEIEVIVGHSDLPAAPLSAGSNSTASACSAVLKACEALRERLIRRAIGAAGAALAGRDAQSVRVAHHALVADGASEPLAAAIRRAGRGRAMVGRATYSPHGVPPLIAPTLIRRGLPVLAGGTLGIKDRLQFAFGAQFAEVRVDRHLGTIRVPRMTGAFAAGRIVNPRTARSQLMGGMIWGLSSALHEEAIVDRRSARVLNADLADYLIPVCADVGEVDVLLVDERDDDINPLGIKGVGEIGMTGMAAAIANAVYHATGVRVRDLPIRIEHLLAQEAQP